MAVVDCRDSVSAVSLNWESGVPFEVQFLPNGEEEVIDPTWRGSRGSR